MRHIVIIVLALQIATCGQKGPLELPAAAAAPVSSLVHASRE